MSNNKHTSVRKFISQAEEYVKNDDLFGAIELVLKNLGPRFFMVRIRLIGLTGRLNHLKKNFLSGQISHESYSISRTKLTNLFLFIIRDLKTSNIRLARILVCGASIIFGAFLLVFPIFRHHDGIAVSLPKVKKTKITFQIFNKSNIYNRVSFIFNIPKEKQNSLMPSEYVNLILMPKDTIQLDIIQKMDLPNVMSKEGILKQLKKIKKNEVEVRSLKKGILKLEFFAKRDLNAHPKEIFQYLEIYCFHEDNIDVPCKKRIAIWDYLHQFQVKFGLVLWTIISFVFLVKNGFRSLNFNTL